MSSCQSIRNNNHSFYSEGSIGFESQQFKNDKMYTVGVTLLLGSIKFSLLGRQSFKGSPSLGLEKRYRGEEGVLLELHLVLTRII